ncbi:MAG: hypothetical protein M1840_008793 [Geoglossum simile]|nr:MAG: hypothetical protein M1840_008793 [Geoglossum simile]
MQSHRSFRAPTALAIKQMPPRPTIKEEDIEEAFLKGSGPGGQKINKTSSAVQLKHRPTGLITKSQATRSRSQNRNIARRLLAERLEEMEKGPESRKAIKAEAARKKKASKTKKAKRKYRNLDGGNGAIGTSEDGGIDGTKDEGLPVGASEGILDARR